MTLPTRSIPIALTLERHAPMDGTAIVIDRSVLARFGRAGLGFFACFLIAFLCVFIPLLHFILVPTFLVAAIALFFVRLRDDCSLVEVRSACPRCKSPRVFKPSGRFRDGRSLHCDGCGESLRIVLRAEADIGTEATLEALIGAGQPQDAVPTGVGP